MAFKKTISTMAGVSMLVLSTAASAAPIERVTMQDIAAARAATPTTANSDLRGRRKRDADTWLISLLALLAFIAGLVAALSQDDQPESP